MKNSVRLTAILFALSVPWAWAQEPAAEEEEAELKNEIGVFVGALSNLETDETGPGVGFDYTREASEKLGIVALAEWANAGDRDAMFGGGIVWKPGW